MLYGLCVCACVFSAMQAHWTINMYYNNNSNNNSNKKKGEVCATQTNIFVIYVKGIFSLMAVGALWVQRH